jgi:hypothetical protein
LIGIESVVSTKHKPREKHAGQSDDEGRNLEAVDEEPHAGPKQGCDTENKDEG